MKLLLPLLTVCALSAPCLAQSPVDSDAVPPAPKSVAATDAFVWKMQPEVGSRWEMRTFTRMKQTVNVPAMEGQPAQSTGVNLISRLSADYDVLSRDKFGATTIRLTYRDLSSSATIQTDGKTLHNATGGKIGKALDGVSYTVKMAPDGTVWNVVGLEKFQNAMLRSQGLSPTEQAQARALTSSMFSKEAMNKMMRTMTGGAMPSYPIRVGENWKYNAELPAGLPFQFQLSGTRALKTLDQTTAAIAEQLTFNGAKLDIKAPNQPGVSIDMKGLVGSYSGTTRVDRASGLPLETTLNFNFGGDIKMTLTDPATAAPKTVVVPVQMTGATHMVMEPRPNSS